jgi:hypothetical protein
MYERNSGDKCEGDQKNRNADIGTLFISSAVHKVSEIQWNPVITTSAYVTPCV